MREVIITVTDPNETVLDRKEVKIENPEVTELVVIDEEGCSNYTCQEHAHLTIGKQKKEAGVDDAAAKTQFRAADKMELAKWLYTLYPVEQRLPASKVDVDIRAIFAYIEDELEIWIHNHYEDDWIKAWDDFAQSKQRSDRQTVKEG